jgi:hypothetical protein
MDPMELKKIEMEINDVLKEKFEGARGENVKLATVVKAVISRLELKSCARNKMFLRRLIRNELRSTSEFMLAPRSKNLVVRPPSVFS